MYKTCRRLRFADGKRPPLDCRATASFSLPNDLARAARYLQKGPVRADEGTRLLRAHCLHLWRVA